MVQLNICAHLIKYAFRDVGQKLMIPVFFDGNEKTISANSMDSSFHVHIVACEAFHVDTNYYYLEFILIFASCLLELFVMSVCYVNLIVLY